MRDKRQTGRDGTGREGTACGFNHEPEVPVRELREFRGISEFGCRSVLDLFWKFPIFCPELQHSGVGGGHVWCFASFLVKNLDTQTLCRLRFVCSNFFEEHFKALGGRRSLKRCRLLADLQRAGLTSSS